jgi:GTP-binding protein
MSTSQTQGPAEQIPAQFLTSAPSLRDCPPDDTPEVAFAGRSNAGKSSVLNQLTGNRNLARTSKTPGRTQMLNFFESEWGGRLVDLPGYGYAAASKEKRRGWQRHVEAYLAERRSLAGLVLVMDARHAFQPFDQQMIDWAVAAEMPTLVLLNKADKLKQSAKAKTLREANDRLAHIPHIAAVLFSATTGLGRDAVMRQIALWLEAD